MTLICLSTFRLLLSYDFYSTFIGIQRAPILPLPVACLDSCLLPLIVPFLSLLGLEARYWSIVRSSLNYGRLLAVLITSTLINFEEDNGTDAERGGGEGLVRKGERQE